MDTPINGELDISKSLANRLSSNHTKNPNTLTQKLELYSLFHLECNKWIRVSTNAYSLVLAYRVFGFRMAANPLEFQIRRIRIKSLEAK